MRRENEKIRVIATMLFVQEHKEFSLRQLRSHLLTRWDIQCDRKTNYDDLNVVSLWIQIEPTGVGRNAKWKRIKF